MGKSKQSVEQYYDQFAEQDRLASIPGQLEFERSKRIITRHMTKAPSVVVDVGGGAGPYCFWLSSLGHESHLIEPSARLVEVANRRAAGTDPALRPRTFSVGDARKLWCADAFADSVLMFGPLYHLTQAEDRAVALREACRVLKPGGLLFTAAISRAASLADGMTSGALADPAFCDIVSADLKTGHHRNPTDNISYFTDAYFHQPQELAREVSEAGFQALSVLPVEGLAMFATNLEDLWKEEAARERLLTLIEKSERLAEVAGATAHMICVGRRAA